MKQHNYDFKSLSSIALMSIGSSTVWEALTILIYYPFDLIKVRMQRSSEFIYRNTTDGFYQILDWSRGSFKVQELYKGASMYAVLYGLYTVSEFMIYETLLAAITNYTRNRRNISTEHNEISEHHAKERNMFHVVISAFSAGALSAVMLNPLGYLLLVTQNSKSKSVGQVIKTIPNFRSLWKGVHFTVANYGFTAWILFVVLEKVWQILDCSITEAE